MKIELTLKHSNISSSAGNPTIEVQVILEDALGPTLPSRCVDGSSTRLELRDESSHSGASRCQGG